MATVRTLSSWQYRFGMQAMWITQTALATDQIQNTVNTGAGSMPEATCSSTVLSPVLSSGGSIEPPHDPECLPACYGRIDQSLGERVYLGASKKYAGFAGLRR